MELTYENAEKMVLERIQKYPEIFTLVSHPSFKTTLSQILEFEGVNKEFLSAIENQLLIILAFYAPIGELPQNISESTGLPLETAKRVATMIDTLLLQPIHDELIAFEYHWNEELKKEGSLPEASKETREKLELRPENVPQRDAVAADDAGARPLTREEVLKALAPTRTMAKDIESIKEGEEAPVEGYEAYQNLKNGSKG